MKSWSNFTRLPFRQVVVVNTPLVENIFVLHAFNSVNAADGSSSKLDGIVWVAGQPSNSANEQMKTKILNETPFDLIPSCSHFLYSESRNVWTSPDNLGSGTSTFNARVLT